MIATVPFLSARLVIRRANTRIRKSPEAWCMPNSFISAYRFITWIFVRFVTRAVAPLYSVLYRNGFRVGILQIQRVAVHSRGIRGWIIDSFNVSKSVAYDLVRALANERLSIRGATWMNDSRAVVVRQYNIITSNCSLPGASSWNSLVAQQERLEKAAALKRQETRVRSLPMHSERDLSSRVSWAICRWRTENEHG